MARVEGSIRFETFVDQAGEHRFRIVAANGETIAASEGYRNRTDMLDTIQLIQAKAPIAPVRTADE